MASLNSLRQFCLSAVRPPLVMTALVPCKWWKRRSLADAAPEIEHGLPGDMAVGPSELSSGRGGRSAEDKETKAKKYIINYNLWSLSYYRFPHHPSLLPISSMMVAWAACPYRSTTAYTLEGTFQAAGPWGTPFTKKCKLPSSLQTTPTVSPACDDWHNEAINKQIQKSFTEDYMTGSDKSHYSLNICTFISDKFSEKKKGCNESHGLLKCVFLGGVGL